MAHINRLSLSYCWHQGEITREGRTKTNKRTLKEKLIDDRLVYIHNLLCICHLLRSFIHNAQGILVRVYNKRPLNGNRLDSCTNSFERTKQGEINKKITNILCREEKDT